VPFVLQEALWKLDVARKRAATWGFDMLVPLGRIHRGIQTQPGEIWASTAAVTSAATATAHSAAKATAVSGSGVASYAAVSASTTTTTASSSSRVLLAAGAELSAEADPEAAASSLWAGAAGSTRSQVPRKAPAFTQHTSRYNDSTHQTAGGGTGIAADRSASATATAGATEDAALLQQECHDARLLCAAVGLLSEGAVELLPMGTLLKLIASLYSAKAAADARDLRSHSTPASLWGFVLKQLQGPGSNGSSGGGCRGSSGSSNVGGPSSLSEVEAALAQLLGSVQAHAGANKEVAAFQAAFLSSIPHSCAAAAGLTAQGDDTGVLSRPQSAGDGTRGESGSGRLAGTSGRGSSSRSATPQGPGRSAVLFRGTWGEVSE